MQKEKLTESITFKCTHEEKCKLESIARSKKISLSELARSLGMEEISRMEEFLNCLQKEFGLTTDTVDTDAHHFELTPQPRFIDVTPQKSQTEKRLSCRNQLSLLATSSTEIKEI